METFTGNPDSTMKAGPSYCRSAVAILSYEFRCKHVKTNVNRLNIAML